MLFLPWLLMLLFFFFVGAMRFSTVAIISHQLCPVAAIGRRLHLAAASGCPRSSAASVCLHGWSCNSNFSA